MLNENQYCPNFGFICFAFAKKFLRILTLYQRPIFDQYFMTMNAMGHVANIGVVLATELL